MPCIRPPIEQISTNPREAEVAPATGRSPHQSCRLRRVTEQILRARAPCARPTEPGTAAATFFLGPAPKKTTCQPI